MQPKEQQRSECLKLFCNLSTIHSLFDCKDVLMIIHSYCLSLRFDHIRSQHPGIQFSIPSRMVPSFRPGHIRFVNDFRTRNGSLLEMPLLMLHAKIALMADKKQAPQVFVLNLKKEGLLHRLGSDLLYSFNMPQETPVGDASLNYVVGTTNRPGQWFRLPIPRGPMDPLEVTAQFSDLYNEEVFLSMIIDKPYNEVYILYESGEVLVFDLETMKKKYRTEKIGGGQCMSLDCKNGVLVIGSIEGIYVWECYQWKLKVQCGNVKAICVEGNLIGVIRNIQKCLSVIEFYDLKTGSFVAKLNQLFEPFGIAFNKSILAISDPDSNLLHVFRWDWSCFL